MSYSDGLNENNAASRRARGGRGAAYLMLVLGLLLFGAAAIALYVALQPVTLRIAVGPAGSDDDKLVQTLAKWFARNASAVRFKPIETEGTVESIALLAAGKTDLAVARGDLEMPVDATSVAIIRKNIVALWSPTGAPPKGARKPAKIKEIADLAGHRVGVIGRTTANVVLLRVILTEAGVNPDKVAITQFGTDQIAELAKDPAIDAFMAVGPPGSKITADAIAATAASRGEPRFLPVDVSEVIAQKHPRYESGEIAGSTFSPSPARPDDKIETVSVNHLIIAPSSLSDVTVGALIRQLLAARPALTRELPNAEKIEKPDTDKDAALPAHPGAAAYIDGTERTFLERYSDFFWATILLLSGLGSGAAWLRHYLKREEHDENTLHRDKLMAMLARVRSAQTPNDLAIMQDEVDGLLRETLRSFDDGALEAGDLSAIGLVLDRFHHAISDRRAAIGLPPAELPRLRGKALEEVEAPAVRLKSPQWNVAPDSDISSGAEAGIARSRSVP